MRRSAVGFLIGVVFLLVCAEVGVTADGVRTIVTFDRGAGEHPEGVVVDKRGRIYVSMPAIGELRRIDRDGAQQLVAVLPTGGGLGPVGLAVEASGDVYAAVITFDPATHGVYRVTPGGSVTRLPGTAGIGVPNGVTFGDRGVLYITDSSGGAVWRVPKGEAAELWLQDDLLEGDGSAPLPFPLGANGITYRQSVLYVTNTELGRIVRVAVRPDGSPADPEVLVQSPLLGGADGLTIDVHGDLYVAVIGQSTIVRVSGDGATIATLATATNGLDFASSLAFGTGKGDRTTLFIVNYAVGPPGGAGPALLSLETGVPGLPQP